MTPMRILKTALTPTTGTNAVQTVASTGTPAGGTFRLEYDGQVTGALAHNISSANFLIAMEELSNIGEGGLDISGANLAAGYALTFVDQVGGRAVRAITLYDNSLTGGTNPTITITQTTAGADATLLGTSFPNDILYSTATNQFYVQAAAQDYHAPTWTAVNAAAAAANPSSALQTTGFLLPKLDDAARDALTPVAGMLIYNTTDDTVEVYDGSAWVLVGPQP
jgi:hypothetical protein